MSRSSIAGKVQTVLGPVSPDDLGVTLTHEHVLIDLRCYFAAPEEASERAYIDRPITMDMLGRVRKVWAYSNDNLTLLDERAATDEVMEFKLAGGGSLVDATSMGIGRDPLMLARMSRRTGLNFIMGASHYTPVSHPADMDSRSEDAIMENIVRDITVGVGDTGIKSGIIGEIGCWFPMNENVKKVLRASGRAQKATGAPILVHPPFDFKELMRALDILVKAGADVKRVIMGHLDLTAQDKTDILTLAKTGCYLEWDTFGNEDTTKSPLSPLERINDAQRMEKLEWVVENGYGDRLVVAHDVCIKPHLVRYGGKGYGHILTSIVPRMWKRGWTQAQIDAVLVENPKRVLAFV
ncbi:MAG: aryldialkylphosphatase [SAR202 cluster bacterium]|nr:aryldialkylphosphatase [SAR202 cluster bacterium]